MSKKINQKIVGSKVVNDEPAVAEVSAAAPESNIIPMHAQV